MKYKTIAALALSLLVATACVKKEDFDMSNLRVQGDFDPTYGFPLAYFEAHMDTLVEFIRAMDSGELIAGPDVVSRGFVYIKESEDLLTEATAVAQSAVENCLDEGADWNTIKTAVRDAMGDFVWKNLKRKPMILPIIEEA